MKKASIGKRILSLFLTLVLGVSLVQMSALAEETPNDVTALIESGICSVKITQNGQEVSTGGTLDTAQPVTVEYSFDVPVAGDVYAQNPDAQVDPSTVVQNGDTAVFKLPGFDLDQSTKELKVQFDGDNTAYNVGSVAFQGDTATVKFQSTDGVYATEKPAAGNFFHGVHVDFSAEMKVDVQKISSKNEMDMTLMNQTFHFNLQRTPKYTLTKTVQQDKDHPEVIHWTIRAEAKYEDGGKLSLAGCTLTDCLKDAGEYQNHFKIEEDSAAQARYSGTDQTLTYVFPDESALSSATITYDTKAVDLEDTLAGGSVSKSYKNAAALTKGGETLDTVSQQTQYSMPSPVKTGYVSDATGAARTYADAKEIDYNNLYITWKITVNQNQYDLKNVSIRDVLPKGLTWVSAKTDAGGSITPVENMYQLGDLSKAVTLTIVSKLDPSKLDGSFYKNGETYSPIRSLVFENCARMQWGVSGSMDSNCARVATDGTSDTNGTALGFNPISKDCVDNQDYTPDKHTVNWHVVVDTKGYSYGGNLRVLDLMVYGSQKLDLNNIAPPDGITSDMLKNAPQQLNQKYSDAFKSQVGDSQKTLSHQVYTLKDKEGKAVADLLVVSDLSETSKNDFSYNTQITNPDLYAANRDGANGLPVSVHNSAALCSGSNLISSSEAVFEVPSCMLWKDAMPFTDSVTADAVAQKQNDGTEDRNGFNYTDRTAIFRIYVNGGGIDLSKDTNFTGKSFTVSDVLAEGWSFEKLDGKDFLLFSGTSDKTQNVKDRYKNILSPAASDDAVTMEKAADNHSAVFTFKNLPTKPYILVVKAKLSAEKFAELCQKSGNKNVTISKANTATLTTDGVYSRSVTDYEDLQISPKVLAKTYQKAEEGVLDWTVDFNSYGLRINDSGKTSTEESGTAVTVTDTIPEGIDLRTDAAGNLKLDGNIALTKLNMDSRGEVTAGSPCALKTSGTKGTDYIVSYDLASRQMTISLPDDGGAYRLTYKTDITGAPGEIENKVSLNSAKWETIVSSKTYKIQDTDASATMKRGGWLCIVKRGARDQLLSGAAFTLTARNSATIFRRGTTNGEGKLLLLALPEGEYTLTETQAPQGYRLPVNKTYAVSVTANSTVTVDGNALTGNTVSIYNEKTDAASLAVSKTVAGNAADRTKAFTFTVTLPGAGADTYYYIGSGIASGTMNGGENTIALKNGQSIVVTNLPAGGSYTVTEASDLTGGYTTAVNGRTGLATTGTLESGAQAQAAFVNTRNITDVPGTPSDPGIDIPENPTPGTDAPVTPTPPSTDIPDGGTPAANLPDGHVPQSEKAVAPKTGDRMFLWAALAASSAAGLSVLLLRRRREEGTRSF